MNAIVKTSVSELSTVTADGWEALKNSLYPGKSDAAISMVISYCAARGYDPLKKPVHLVKMWNSDLRKEIEVVLPGINQYRIDAARTGQYVGKSEPVYGPMVQQEFIDKDKQRVTVTYPEWCKVTVRRLIKGMVAEFTATEYWLECYATQGRGATAPNAMWEKRARGQLAKVAEAQALRMAFPEEMADYTAEEMEGKAQPPEIPPATGPQIDHRPAPVAEVWPLFSPDARPLKARNASQWRQWALAAIGKMESAEALAGWTSAMEEHFADLATRDAALVEEIRAAAQDRLDDLAGANGGEAAA